MTDTEMRDYAEFSQGPLVFPIRGKRYEAPEVGIELGIRLAGMQNGTSEQDLPMLELYKLVLGPAWDQMVADGVPLDAAMRAGMVAIADRMYGREYALASWEAGLDPKAVAELMTPPGNRASRRSKSTGAARKTPPRASTTGTTSPNS